MPMPPSTVNPNVLTSCSLKSKPCVPKSVHMKMDNPTPSIITTVTFLKSEYTVLIVYYMLSVACKDREVCGSPGGKVAVYLLLRGMTDNLVALRTGAKVTQVRLDFSTREPELRRHAPDQLVCAMEG